MSDKSLSLSIYSPEELIYSGTVTYILVPVENGSIGILPNHTPLLSSLSSGIIRYKVTESKQSEYQVNNGIIKILDNKVNILTY